MHLTVNDETTHLIEQIASSLLPVFESGTFTLSADGSAATLGMNGDTPTSLNHKVRFLIDATEPVQPVVGQTITNDDTGATGVVVSLSTDGAPADEVYVTLNNLTVGGWANAANITYGETSIIILDETTFIITIPTAKKLKLWQGLTFADSDNDILSDGRSNQIINSVIALPNGVYVSGVNNPKCIHINDGINGWRGLITTINNTSFDITLTQIGAGLAITGQIHLTES